MKKRTAETFVSNRKTFISRLNEIGILLFLFLFSSEKERKKEVVLSEEKETGFRRSFVLLPFFPLVVSANATYVRKAAKLVGAF